MSLPGVPPLDPIVRRVAPGRLYYGWIVVGAAFLVLFFAYGIQFSFGVFLPELVEEFDWPQAQVTPAYSIYVLLYALLGTFAGAFADRFGPRVVLLGGALLLGTAYFFLGRITTLWHLYILLALVAGVGMSTTMVPLSATVVRWFVRLRGTAAGIMLTGTGVGTLAVPALAGALVQGLGWRSAYQVLALLLVVVLVAAAFLMVRDPERMGLQPDGGRSGVVPVTETIRVEVGYRQREAARTTTFWVMTTAIICSNLFVFMPGVVLATHAQDLGVSAARAVLAISAWGAGSAVGRAALGFWSDRIGRRRAARVAFGFQALGFGLLATVPIGGGVYLFGFLAGLGYGGFTAVWPALVADLFGKQHAGSVFGLSFAIAGPPAAVGPTLAGAIHDVFGTYAWAFAIALGGNILALVVFSRLRPPRREVAHEADMGSA